MTTIFWALFGGGRVMFALVGRRQIVAMVSENRAVKSLLDELLGVGGCSFKARARPLNVVVFGVVAS